ncbi:MAG: GNAT family N-acetyltransferase [Chlamydiota bacterium]
MNNDIMFLKMSNRVENNVYISHHVYSIINFFKESPIRSCLLAVSFLSLLYYVVKNRFKGDKEVKRLLPANNIKIKETLNIKFKNVISHLEPSLEHENVSESIKKLKEIFQKEQELNNLFIKYAFDHACLHYHLVKITGAFKKTSNKIQKVWEKFLIENHLNISIHYPNKEIIKLNLTREIRDLTNELTPLIKFESVSSLSLKEQSQFTVLINKSFSHPFNPPIDNPNYFKKNNIFIAKDKNEIVGFLVFNIEESYIEAVACAPQYVRFGIGTRLLKELASVLDRKETKPKNIELEVRTKNPAKLIYEKIGFKKDTNTSPTKYIYPAEYSLPMVVPFTIFKKSLLG